MAEKLLTPEQAAPRLGLSNGEDVCRLIRRGKLRARKLVVRGRGGKPRWRIQESAIDEFILSLPETEVTPSAPFPTTSPKRDRHERRGLMEGIHQFV